MSAFCAWWREREREADPAAAERHVRAVVAELDVDRPDAADLDVVRGDAGRGRRDLGHDRDPALGERGDSSAFERATPSTEPTSSRWTGPTAVITPMSGRAISQSSAIWPKPRMPISTMQTSVSGSSRPSVSGTPSSAL